VIFADLTSALAFSLELLSCPIRAVNYDPDRIFGALTASGNGYNMALDIKIAADRAAHRIGAEDDRGNWILLALLPLDEPIRWRDWEKRKTEDAIDVLTEALVNKGYLIRRQITVAT
jgi:hypothetical protein